jgi:hypothetical protein
MTGWRSALVWLAAALLFCTGACAKPGGKVFRYADAQQVPVAVTERDQLAALLAGFAQRNGLYYRDTSPRVQRTSNGRQTLALALQRPLTNGRPWSEIEVTATGNGPALMTFVRPLDRGAAADADQGRTRLVAELRRRWPATQPVPVLPDGAIPRQNDLRQTPKGLRIDPARAADYHLSADSPLLAR